MLLKSGCESTGKTFRLNKPGLNKWLNGWIGADNLSGKILQLKFSSIKHTAKMEQQYQGYQRSCKKTCRQPSSMSSASRMLWIHIKKEATTIQTWSEQGYMTELAWMTLITLHRVTTDGIPWIDWLGQPMLKHNSTQMMEQSETQVISETLKNTYN